MIDVSIYFSHLPCLIIVYSTFYDSSKAFGNFIPQLWFPGDTYGMLADGLKLYNAFHCLLKLNHL